MSTNESDSSRSGLVLIVDDGGAPRDDVDDMLDSVAREIGVEIVRDKIVACEKCQHLFCVCQVLADHVQGCRFRLATTCAIPIPCLTHGLDVCVPCGDGCTCEEVKKASLAMKEQEE